MLKAALIATGCTVAVVAIGAVIAEPMAERWFDGRSERESSYATGAAAKADADAGPTWLPDGATKVRLKIKTRGGDRILVANIPAAGLPEGCVPATRHDRPGLTAGWFPKGVTHKGSFRCGTYSGYTEGGKLVAWQRDEDPRAAGTG